MWRQSPLNLTKIIGTDRWKTIPKLIWYKVRTSNCGRWKSGEETSHSATSARTPSTTPRRKVTVCPVLFKIVIGKSSPGTEITDKISTCGWHTGSNTAKSASDRNLEFKRKEKFTPEWGLILTLLDNATVLTVCARTLWPSDKWTGIAQSPTVKVFSDSLISSWNLAIKSKPRMQWLVMSAFNARHLNDWSPMPIIKSSLKVAVTGAPFLIPFRS